jgi:O-antigen ligase
MTDASRDRLARIGFVALAACLGLIQLNIITAEACFDIAAIAWVVLAISDRGRPDVPTFFVPLLALAAWTIVSAALSSEPAASLLRSRQLCLYLIVPMAMRFARGSRARTIADVVIAIGAIGAVIGIVQYAVLGYDDLHARPHGLLGHYMTYSGVLMLVICTAVARLIYAEREWIWPAVAVPALLVALAVTLSRNAWVGALLGIVVLFGLRRPRLLVAVPIVVAIALLAAPVRSRALSMFDPHNPTNRDRISMIRSGEAMIKDHWFAGVGPNMVPVEYLAHYKRADAVDPVDQPGSTRAHLHNVPVQLAAERGLPALAAWLWFVVVAIRDVYRLARRGRAPALAAGGLAVMAAMLTAGLFEHNFGDSEFLILFLGLITLPFAAVANEPAQRAETVPVRVARVEDR